MFGSPGRRLRHTSRGLPAGRSAAVLQPGVFGIAPAAFRPRVGRAVAPPAPLMLSINQHGFYADCQDSPQLRAPHDLHLTSRQQIQNLPGVDHPCSFVILFEMLQVAGNNEIGLGGLGTLVESVVGFVS